MVDWDLHHANVKKRPPSCQQPGLTPIHTIKTTDCSLHVANCHTLKCRCSYRRVPGGTTAPLPTSTSPSRTTTPTPSSRFDSTTPSMLTKCAPSPTLQSRSSTAFRSVTSRPEGAHHGAAGGVRRQNSTTHRHPVWAVQQPPVPPLLPHPGRPGIQAAQPLPPGCPGPRRSHSPARCLAPGSPVS